MAIRFANSHINVGNIVITKLSEDDSILDNLMDFTPNSTVVLFELGWGRRNERYDSTLYGKTYINSYRERLTEFYEEGRKIQEDECSNDARTSQIRKSECFL